MTASIKVRRGKSSRASWGSGPTNLGVNEYTRTHKADRLDYTTFESSGKSENTTGVEDYEFSVKGNWNAAYNPNDSPPGIYPRDDGGPLRLYMNQSDAAYDSLPVVTVLSTEVSSSVRSNVGFNFGGVNNGTFTLATGSF